MPQEWGPLNLILGQLKCNPRSLGIYGGGLLTLPLCFLRTVGVTVVWNRGFCIIPYPQVGMSPVLPC